MSSLQKSVLRSKLPPTRLNFELSRNLQRKRDYDPLPWDTHYDTSEDIQLDLNTFHIYTRGTEGPILVLLHGGGYSALTWAEFSKCVTNMVVCKVVAIDLRGHGDTHTTNDDDLSAETLASDVASIINKIANNEPVILVGHSMGGAVAVHTASLIPNLIGVTVIDVVEGTAMEALVSMQSFLRSRPTTFISISQAIEWSLRSGQIRNILSAKISVPGQIKNIQTGKLATHDIEHLISSPEHEPNPEPVFERGDVIQEEEDESNVILKPPMGPPASDKKYTWRIDLAKTEKYWEGWFKGLSAAFLNIPAPKMLLLAGVDRLDRDLTVGQMQGRFQMQVLPACGHAVHEDAPDKVAEVIATFLVRNKFTEPASNFPRTMPAC